MSARRLVWIAVQIAVAVAVLIWVGGPGPFAGVLVMRVAWEWFFWDKQD